MHYYRLDAVILPSSLKLVSLHGNPLRITIIAVVHYCRLDAAILPSSLKLVSLRVILASSLGAVGHEGLHDGGRDIVMLLYIILLYISLLFVARRQSCRTSRATRRGARYTSSPTTRHTHTHTHTHARTHTRTRTHTHTHDTRHRQQPHTHTQTHAYGAWVWARFATRTAGEGGRRVACGAPPRARRGALSGSRQEAGRSARAGDSHEERQRNSAARDGTVWGSQQGTGMPGEAPGPARCRCPRASLGGHSPPPPAHTAAARTGGGCARARGGGGQY